MEQARVQERNGARIFLCYLLLVPCVLWMGVTDWAIGLSIVGLILFLAAYARWLSTRQVIRQSMLWVGLAMQLGLTALVTRMFGPVIAVPGIAALGTLGFLLVPNLKHPWLTIALGCCAILIPSMLEWIGVLSPSYAFDQGSMMVLPRMVQFPAVPTQLMLVLLGLSVVIGTGSFVHWVRKAQLRAERKLHLQAWHLRQLVRMDAQD